jgi:hypothetical protein
MKEQLTYLMAGHPQTSVQHLELLAANAWPKVRMRVAENPNSPLHVLHLLSKDDDPDVRMSVANNSKASLVILHRLANDQSADVRFYLAEDQNLPRVLLRRLSEDDNPFVARRAQLTLVKAAQNKLFKNEKASSSGAGRKTSGQPQLDVLSILRALDLGHRNALTATYK